jgi:putative redox protein
MTASARSVDGGLRHAIDVNGRHTITTDEPESLGGTDTAPAPHEMLPAILASCVATMIVLYARRRDWDLGDVRVDVAYETESAPRGITVSVHLPEGLTSDQLERLRRVADTCPVKRALQAGFTFSEQVVGDLPASRRAVCEAAA